MNHATLVHRSGRALRSAVFVDQSYMIAIAHIILPFRSGADSSPYHFDKLSKSYDVPAVRPYQINGLLL